MNHSQASEQSTDNHPVTTVALLDARHRVTGGIKSLNDDLEQSSLRERYRFVRSGLHDLSRLMTEECAAGRSLICIFDESFTWSRLHQVLMGQFKRARLCAHGWTCRFVGREHHYTGSFVEHRVPNRTRFELMLRLAYRMMDQVIAVSHGQAQWMRERKLLPAGKIATIIHAVDIASLLGVPIRKPAQPVVFGSIGRLAFQKGIDVLLEAWAQLPETCDAQLLIGGFGPDEERLRARAANLRGVTFAGKVTDRADFFNKCDVIVMPSRYEPGAQVCIESRAAARPLIASNVDCFPEQPHECRLLFRSGDPEELKDQILQTITMIDLGKYPAIAEAARASAIKAEQAYLPRLTAFFDSLLGQSCSSTSS